jgi:hypothetical protein
MKGLLFAVIAALSFTTVASAQLRGMGRVAGSVVDDSGGALPGVSVTATLEGRVGSITASSDDKGAWAIGGITKGDWDVVFEKSGYGSGRAKIHLPVELARVPPITVTMKKASTR